MDEVFHAHVARIADLIYEVAKQRQMIRLEFTWENKHSSTVHNYTFTRVEVLLTHRECTAKVHTRTKEDICHEASCILWDVQEDGDIYSMFWSKDQFKEDTADMLLSSRMTRLYDCVKSVMDKAYPKEVLT